MKLKQLFLTVAVCALAAFYPSANMAQSKELMTFEVAPVFTTITKPDFTGGKTEAGFGGRLTFNLNDNVALEGEGNFFPHHCRTCSAENFGTLTQALGGVKAGKRFSRFGLFAKARPGLASFSEGEFHITAIPVAGTFPFLDITRNRQTHFAFDLGGVLELYHSPRVFTRFDAGDTMIRYGQHTFDGFSFNQATGAVTVIPITRRADTRHNFQFSASVGFRF
jgi:hypothetical protein